MTSLNALNGEVSMKEYRGVVVMRAYQTRYVEAESEDEARQLMQEQFELRNAEAEMDVLDLEEVK
jgi:DNA-dependent RNA polymerase auxiliary subunit epsilon